MTDLPTEIWEKIFLELDGVSLGRIACVCKRWKNVYQQFTPKVWEVICKQEIPPHSLQDIKSKICTTKSSVYKKCDIWKNIYIDWCVWKKFPNMNNTKQTTTINNSTLFQRQISCMKVSGSVILTGCRSGAVRFWDFQLKQTFKLFLCKSAILDIALFDNTCQDSKKLPGMLHDTIIATTQYRQLVTVRMLQSGIYKGYGEKLTSKPTMPHMIRTNGADIGAVLCTYAEQGASISVFRVVDRPGQHLPELVSLYKYTVDFVYFGCCINVSSENQLTILNEVQIPCMFTLDTGEFISSNIGGVPLTSDPPLISVLLRHNILIQVPCFADSVEIDDLHTVIQTMDLKIQVNKSSKIYSVLSLVMWPSSFLLHGTMFFIGTQNGDIFAYCVPVDTDLLSLNLGNFVWRHTGNGYPILNMDVWHRDEERGLVIVTPGTVCQVAVS